MNKDAFCTLVGRKRMGKREVDGYLINDVNVDYIKEILERGCACTSADDNGSLCIWKTKAGVIRGEVMRNWCTIEEKVFSDYSEIIEWATKWLDYIGCKIPMPTEDNSAIRTAFNPMYKRDVERVIMQSRENMLDAFCDAGCGKRLNYDGNGNPCARNCCTKFVEFVKLVKTKPIRNLETQEAKEAVARHCNQSS